MDDDNSPVPVESPRDPLLLSPFSENAAQERISKLQEKVFGNYLIRKEIIRHFLRHTANSVWYCHNIENSLSSYAAKKLRLVNTTWCDETNKTFLSSKIPLFGFTLFHPISSDYDRPRHRRIKSYKMVQYLNFFTSFLDGSSPPPFALNVIIQEPWTNPIDIWYLQNILSKESIITSLVKLTIKDGEPDGPRGSHTCCPVVPSSLTLPCLQEINIFYTMGDEAPAENFLAFINSILNAALYLKQLKLEVPVAVSDDNFYWTLPTTLTNLRIYSESFLPRLTTPNLSKPTAPMYLPKLKMLKVYGSREPLIGTLDIPTMSKLVSTMTHLQTLKLCRMSEEDLKMMWCHPGWNNWPTVKTLVIHDFRPISHEYMASIKQSFPSVVHFDFRLLLRSRNPSFEQWTSQLRHLFQEMTQLKSLKLNIVGMKYDQEFVMDSILLGITSEKATQLRQDPTLWDNFIEKGQGDFGEQKQCESGIRNFRYLKSLHLDCSNDYTPHDAIPDDDRPPMPGIISPLVFRLGFMQLPQLEELNLEYGFSIGMDEIGDEWLEQSNARKLQLIDDREPDDDDMSQLLHSLLGGADGFIQL